VAEFENNNAARLEMHCRLRDEIAVEFVAFFTTVECHFRFVVANFAHQRCRFASTDVRRIASDQVEEKWRVRSGEWRAKQTFEQIAVEKMDAGGDPVAGSIAAGNDEGSG